MLTAASFWLFLLSSTIIYWSTKKKYRYWVLAIISYGGLIALCGSVTGSQGELSVELIFSKERISLLVLFGWIFVFYKISPKVHSNNYVVPALIISILCYLAYYKYIPKILSALYTQEIDVSLLVPIGVSYYTFKLIHYLVEKKRNNINIHSFDQFFCYITLFTIFTAGPIEKFNAFLKNHQSHPSMEMFEQGITRILYGLIKKFLIIGIVINGINPEPSVGSFLAALEEHSSFYVWYYLILYFLVSYLGFSAYSDIAIGSSRLFGFKISENFNWPILANNISEFWKRWHMTLAAWCQTYVYMPTIGLFRKPILSIFVTFAALGLWHAGTANWLAWGLYHAIGIATHKYWIKYQRNNVIPGVVIGLSRYTGAPITFLFVTGSWVFTMTHVEGDISELYSAIRVLVKCFFIDLRP